MQCLFVWQTPVLRRKNVLSWILDRGCQGSSSLLSSRQDEDRDDWQLMQITHHRLQRPTLPQHFQSHRAIMAPTGVPAPRPLWIMSMRWQIFLGISPNTQQLSNSSVMSWISLCITVPVHLCARFSVCDWMSELHTQVSHRADVSSVSGDGEHPCLSHMWLVKQIHTLNNGWNINICHSSAWIVPKQGARSLRGPPQSTACHLSFCASLTFCLSYMNIFSPHLPSQRTLSSACPSFLAAVEVTFINGEFMCMTAQKPELCFDQSLESVRQFL